MHYGKYIIVGIMIIIIKHTVVDESSYIVSQSTNGASLTLYDPGGGFKSHPPPPIFCSHAFNFGAALLCVGDFSQKIV